MPFKAQFLILVASVICLFTTGCTKSTPASKKPDMKADGFYLDASNSPNSTPSNSPDTPLPTPTPTPSTPCLDCMNNCALVNEGCPPDTYSGCLFHCQNRAVDPVCLSGVVEDINGLELCLISQLPIVNGISQSPQASPTN